jgi:ASC-1-like (ASCH) protein
MEYELDINPAAFQAIKIGAKTVEGRTPTSTNKTPYEKFIKGDKLRFVNHETGEKVLTEVKAVRHYNSIKEMLEKEGKEKVLSKKDMSIKECIKLYESFPEYKENVQKNGIYAIEISLVL